MKEPQALMNDRTQSFAALDEPADPQAQDKRQREWLIRTYIDTLNQANLIRANPDLMTEIRAHLRKSKDDITTMLDEIGG